MAKLAIKKASTDVTTYVFIQDSSKTTGEGLTGLTFETASLVASYVRPLAARAAITLATQTVTGAHSDGGFVEVDATNMPGVYRLDLPDAVCATGVPSVVVMLKGAANLAPVLLEIQLTDFDLNDASPNVTVNDMATDSLTAAALKADAVTEIQNGLALEATLTAIKGAGWQATDSLRYIQANASSTYSVLDESGAVRILIDSIITHLTDIKGAGWTNQTLAKIVTDIAAISAGSGASPQEIWEYATRVLTAGTNIDLSSLATAAMLTDLHDTDIPAIKTETAAIKAKSDLIPATPAEAGEYTTAIAAVKSVADDILVDTGTTLDTLVKDIPTNAELTTALGTADDAVLAALATTDGKIDSILEDTGTTLDTLIKDIPTNTELATALGTADDAVLAAVAAAKVVIDDIHNTDLPAVKAETALIVEDTGTTIPALLETIDNFLDTEVAAILEDTGTTLPATLATLAGYTDGIAGDVWSHAKRTLTVPAVAAAATEDGTTLTLYKDADINIEFTGLTIPTGAKKVVFTIKDNLDDADTASALQATYQLTAVPAETHTLNYINSAVPPVLTAPVTFTVDTDSVEFDMTAAAAYYLPRYERGYLHWDLKLITATTVQILQQGLVQILGTSTRAVA